MPWRTMHRFLGDMLRRENITQSLNGVVKLSADFSRRVAPIKKPNRFFHQPQGFCAVLLQRTRSISFHTHPCAN